MRIGAFSFAPGWAATVAAFALIALTVWLGRWQLGRAEEKLARQALLEARNHEAPVELRSAGAGSADALLYRRLRASGEWVPAGQVYIDNQIHQGRAGFRVVTPLRLPEGGAVLVERGWIARGADYPAAPRVPVPEGRHQVEGLATRPPARVLELSGDTVSGDVWQNLSIERYRERMRMEVLPVVLRSTIPAPGLAAIAEQPAFGVEKHHEYAFTWFSLASLAFVLWIGMNVRRTR